LYKSHSITKQQYEQALAAKLETESQVRVVEQQQRASAFQKSVIIAKSKFQVSKPKLLRPILEQRRNWMPQN
jgi:hypothetical protein